MASVESNSDISHTPASGGRLSRRRALLVGGLGVAGATVAASLGRNSLGRAAVFVARHQRYDGDLQRTVRDGLLASGLVADDWRGKRVLLKPNLVEPSREIPHMTTHPAVIVAVADVFQQWGAVVSVGEAPGHIRDTEMALVESHVADALHDARIPFADLNYEEIQRRPNRGRFSRLNHFFFPRSVLEADLIVSLPKLKTHHFVGMTASLKNLFGTLPGIAYGWPKNVLHYSGITETVADVACSLPRTIAVVDGIDCMEGDGPILGTCKPMGLIVTGTSLPAVDATITRIMGLDPRQVGYLRLASRSLGPIRDSAIDQRGEDWRDVCSPFVLGGKWRELSGNREAENLA